MPKTKMTNEDKIILLATDSLGQNIPKYAAESFEANIVNAKKLREELEILKKGPEDAQYWDAWDEVERRAVLKADFERNKHNAFGRHNWHFYLNEGLYAYRDDYVFPEE